MMVSPNRTLHNYTRLLYMIVYMVAAPALISDCNPLYRQRSRCVQKLSQIYFRNNCVKCKKIFEMHILLLSFY